jgi:hypothetical protein
VAYLVNDVMSLHSVSQPGHLHTPCLYNGLSPSSDFMLTPDCPIIAPITQYNRLIWPIKTSDISANNYAD